MKKICAMILLFLLLTGCAAAVPKAPAAPNFSFHSACSVECGGKSFGGVWDSTNAGVCSLTLQYPESVAGTVYSCNGEEVSISFDDQSQTVPLSALPEEGAPAALFRLFRKYTAQPLLAEPTQNGELLRFAEADESGSVVLQTDRSGTICEIAFARNALTVRFPKDEAPSLSP